MASAPNYLTVAWKMCFNLLSSLIAFWFSSASAENFPEPPKPPENVGKDVMERREIIVWLF